MQRGYHCFIPIVLEGNVQFVQLRTTFCNNNAKVQLYTENCIYLKRVCCPEKKATLIVGILISYSAD